MGLDEVIGLDEAIVPDENTVPDETTGTDEVTATDELGVEWVKRLLDSEGSVPEPPWGQRVQE